ncbi:UDP-N-acetylmuramoyl-L-alanyl-D-glutamate--2,6-diaminopimelate ligase [Emergencia timonensis]|uniref:UDP-N-acetylmuramoyl-L-alanyl-D-glutamate--2, 6-diaminopimelate ligase n=1 Tax=Emergencia timonensis TaxID=1776384 RepID=UPI00295B699A|nr:UDP-N-acetylmuramoyl-L-alanyl-D-glutamate--2,6-diaminopimelate ligase [Emergencia timonensis]WNX90737.1 UDP-N-acetylmuramoyl-L-alanyl-D-glutamate--2,6-diaminopimelate ligase [Emergencia timonensis]
MEYRIERIKLKLYELLNDFDYQCLQGDEDLKVNKIILDSEKACEASVFVCIKGTLTDGHLYAGRAAERGAAAVVCSEEIDVPAQVTVIKVEDTKKALALMAASLYGWPAEEMKIIGVTGTKGKTTTTYMIKGMLEEAGIKTGLIGTIHIDTGARIIESKHTTPESLEIQGYLREMKDAGCQAAVIEVSSQALMLQRVEAIDFDLGVFTNLEEDHIGPKEHKNFAEYAYWKSTLFKKCKIGIINRDDPCKDLVLKGHTCDIETYGFEDGSDLRGGNFFHVRLPGKLGVEFRVKGSYNIDLVACIPGKFTCYNAMAAIAVCKHFAVSEETIKRALKKISVPGRQEMFSAGNDKVIMVDYAHNGTALRCLLTALRDYRPKKLTCVFGCGGERDPQRRLKMGEAAAKLADFSIITSDNPRNEPPMSIIGDIVREIEKDEGSYMVIPDRREAITYAVSHCMQGGNRNHSWKRP